MTNSAQEQHREWSRAEVEASLREILVDSLGLQEAEVIPSASLVKDLGAESIDFLDIGFKIQQTFGVNLQTAEIRDIIMAWGSLIHPALAEILTGRYNLTVTVDELRGLEKGGLDKILEHLRSAQGLPSTSINRIAPRGEMAEIILQLKRAPVVETIGVWPRAAHVLPE